MTTDYPKNPFTNVASLLFWIKPISQRLWDVIYASHAWLESLINIHGVHFYFNLYYEYVYSRDFFSR